MGPWPRRGGGGTLALVDLSLSTQPGMASVGEDRIQYVLLHAVSSVLGPLPSSSRIIKVVRSLVLAFSILRL